MDIPNTERVEGILHSQWRGPEPPPRQVAGMGCAAILTVSLLLATVFIGLAAAGSWYIRRGLPEIGYSLLRLDLWLFAGLALATVVATAAKVVRLALTARASRGKAILPPRPEGVPEIAVPVTVMVQRGSSQGWLWTDGPWVIFEGDQFDFRVHPANLTNPKQVKTLIVPENPCALVLSEKKSLYVRIAPLYQFEGQTYRSSELANAMRPHLAACLDFPMPVSEPLYPPRQSRTKRHTPLIKRGQAIVLSVATGLVTSLLNLCRPDGPTLEAGIFMFIYGSGVSAFLLYTFLAKPEKRGTEDPRDLMP